LPRVLSRGSTNSRTSMCMYTTDNLTRLEKDDNMIEHRFDEVRKVLVHNDEEVCDCFKKTHYPSQREAYPGRTKELKDLQEEIHGIRE